MPDSVRPVRIGVTTTGPASRPLTPDAIEGALPRFYFHERG